MKVKTVIYRRTKQVARYEPEAQGGGSCVARGEADRWLA